MFFKKIFLLLVLVIFFPLGVSAEEENECVLNGGTCVAENDCAQELTGGSHSQFCSDGETCCETINPDPEEEPGSEHQEGSDDGFLTFQGHIVPCGKSFDNQECTLCHLFIMLKNIFDLMISLLIVTSILFITIGGIIYIVSTGNTNMTTLAKNIIKKTLIGFALMLVSWLIVYTLLVFLSAEDMVGSDGKWYEFNCDIE